MSALVGLVLRKQHPEPWTRAELEAELDDIAPSEIDGDLAVLEAEGVVTVTGAQITASRCARFMDELGMVCI